MDIKPIFLLLASLGVMAYVYKKKADRSGRDAIMGKTEGQDKILKENQKAVEDKIKKVENEDDSSLSPEERAKRWNK